MLNFPIFTPYEKTTCVSVLSCHNSRVERKRKKERKKERERKKEWQPLKVSGRS